MPLVNGKSFAYRRTIEALSERDLRAAVSVSLEWHEAATVSALIDVATRGLHELIPCEAVGWNEPDLVRGSALVLTDPPRLMNVPIERFAKLVEKHPLIEHVDRTGDLGARTISDVVSPRELHRRDLYQEVFRPLGVEDQLATVITGPPVVLGIAFNRRRRDFTRRDRAMLELVKPHLAAAHSRARAFERLRAAERALDIGRQGVVTLGPGGEIDHVLGAAREILGGHFGEIPRTLAPGRYVDGDFALDVQRVDGDSTLLLVEQESLRPDRRRVQELGLTERESEVLALVRRGLGNAEIGEALVVSPRTVQKHLEHVYDKLGVRDRQRAANLLFAR